MSGSTFADALSDPGVSALLGAAQGFGQAAMPTRMPTPWGAVLGAGAGGLEQGLKTGQALQQGQQQLQASQMQNQMTKMYLGALPGAVAGAGTPAGPQTLSPAPSPSSTSNTMPLQTFAMRVNGSENSTGNPAALNASGPGGKPSSSAMGDGQFIDSTWLPLYKQTFPDKAAGMTDAQILAQRADSGTATAMTGAYAKQNAPILQAAGVPPTAANLAMAHRYGPEGGIAVANANPNTPLSGVLGSDAIKANPTWANMTAGQARGAAAMRYGQVPVDFGGGVTPPASSPYLVAPDQFVRLGQLALMRGDPASAAKLFEMSQTPAGGPGYAMSPNGTGFAVPGGKADPRVLFGDAGATAAGTKTGEAPFVAPQQVDVLTTDVAGKPVLDPTGNPTFHKQLMTVPQANAFAAANGPGAGLVAPSGVAGPPAPTPAQMPYDQRLGGMHIDPLSRTAVKNPEPLQITLPGGQKVQGHMNPASPFDPEGTPGTFVPVVTAPAPGTQSTGAASPVVTALPPDVVEGREELTKNLFGKDADSYVAANNTQGWLNQINHAADVMNKAGNVYQTGPYAPQRLALMGAINDAGRTLNLGQPFDLNAISSAEEMRKATTTAGFELSSHYEGHARQAAATIMNATSAVPGMSNSPQGVRLVSNGINEGAQSAKDMHEYNIARFSGQDPYGIAPGSVGARGGAGLESSEADFVKAFPASMYANRAISTVQPFAVKTDADLANYLPGTFVQYKGNTIQVPQRPGAPPIPMYLVRPAVSQ